MPRPVKALSNKPVTPIAVIGMACRLPGDIDSPDLLWDALLRGDDLITEVPAERWDINEIYDPEPGVPGRSVSRWGGFLDDVAGFDFEFFGYGEREATAIDPQQRLLLETSWEAIEHAGLAPSSLLGTSTGVFVGLCHDDYTLLTADAGALDKTYGYLGTAFSVAWGASPTLWDCTVRPSPSTRHVPLACWRFTWPAAACTMARATSPSPGAAV